MTLALSNHTRIQRHVNIVHYKMILWDNFRNNFAKSLHILVLTV